MGITSAMALRIAVGLLVALRAVLIYGEATDLATRPVHLPRLPSFPRARRVVAGS